LARGFAAASFDDDVRVPSVDVQGNSDGHLIAKPTRRPAADEADPRAARVRTLEVVRMPIASSADTVLSMLLVVILVLGYVVLSAIWHFLFRARDLKHRGDDRR
jgi:hypothetical protein